MIPDQQHEPPIWRVAVVEWANKDGIAEAIHDELVALGHQASYFAYDAPIPREVDIIFTFAPYGAFLPIASQLAHIPLAQRPTLVHWNTEGIPDLRMPHLLMNAVSYWRSWMGRVIEAREAKLPAALRRRLLTLQNTRMLRFRYVGDYYYAYKQGWLHIFADSSVVYGQLHTRHGLPTRYMPWGSVPRWYADLNLVRDIDVLWMGKRGTRRRSDLLDRVRAELRPHGVEVYVADNVENPYIFNDERIYFLNRAKITLNITRTWYDDNFSRFSMAAPNRSLVVSEPMLPHCPEFEAGVHYVAAPIERLAETIVHYLRHEDERAAIVENAYQLVTTQLTMRNSIQSILAAVNEVRRPASVNHLRRDSRLWPSTADSIGRAV